MSVYVPPASSTGDTCSGGCNSPTQIRTSYVRSYLTAHALSPPSYRYVYLTWFVFAFVFIVLSASYHLGIADQTFIGAAWSRFALKNRVIKFGRRGKPEGTGSSSSSANRASLNPFTDRGEAASRGAPAQRKKRKVVTFPGLGRMLLLAAFASVPIVLTIIGADYIRPTSGVFDMAESWPNTNVSIFTPGLYRRVLYGIDNFPPVTTNAPSVTLPYKTWWTSGGRTGGMTNGLTPFVLVLALRQIPFALFSTRVFGGIAFDRLSFLHKWGGRMVWLFATVHVVLWSVQLAKDQAFNGSMWSIVFVWPKFRWGFVSYIFLSFLVILSIEPIRLQHYEVFYVAHVVCIIGFMVSAWLHHPPSGQWMWAALLWWLAERITRSAKVAWLNGLGFAGRKPQVAISPPASIKSGRHTAAAPSLSASSATLHGSEYRKTGTSHSHSFNTKRSHYDEYSQDTENGFLKLDDGAIPLAPVNKRRYSLRDDGLDASSLHDGSVTYDHMSSQGSMDHSFGSNLYGRHQGGTSDSRSIAHRRSGPRPAIAADVAAVLRPGYAYAQLLPGKALRLTLRTPNKFTWRPGQYVFLTIPRVRWLQSHPFTVASAYQSEYPSSTQFEDLDAEQGLAKRTKSNGEERTVVLLLRARGGFTNALWDHVRIEREKQIRHIEETTGMQYVHGQVAKTATGVHLRAIIDGPYGSAQRVRWNIHSTIVIICGGSGISFGLSVLEHLCATMAGIRHEPGFKVRRIRFVWILREFSHLQWISSALRRCIELVPPQLLQVDLHVTSKAYSARNAQRAPRNMHSHNGFVSTAPSQDGLVASYDYANGMSTDASFGPGRLTDGPEQEEYDIDADDLVEFAGEDVSAPTAAEARINERVHREGKMRRAATRKATQKRRGGRAGTAVGGRSDAKAHDSTYDAEALASQQAIFDGTARELRPWTPQAFSRRDVTPLAGHRDLGDSNLTAHMEDDGYMSPLGAVNNNRPLGYAYSSRSGLPPSTSERLSPEPSSYFSVDRPGASRLPSGGALSTQLPVSPSPISTPLPPSSLFNSYDSHVRRPSGSGAAYGGASSIDHSFSATPMSSSMNLNMYADGHDHRPHGRSALAQQSFSGGSDLDAVPSNSGDAPIDLDEMEMADMATIAELARPGYPKLDRIIRQEADMAAGRVLVSACGPTSLADLIKSIVSKQIDLKAVRAGKLNAHINVATESYEWGG